jgi:hypothetical protein
MDSFILSATTLVMRVVDAPVYARATTTAEAVLEATSNKRVGLFEDDTTAVRAAVPWCDLD